MHRTTTTATLLVTVAVSALAGCVTVQRPPTPGPPTAPSRPSAPRPDGPAEPQVVQAPAREALEMIGPSRRPKPAAPPSTAAVPPAPAPPRQQPPRTHPARPAHPARPEHRHPDAGQHRRPRVDTPDVPGTIPRNQQDVCALGKKYGGWRADSPEAMICDQTYGR
ncbi:hypothetical protein [Streptomyces cellulosae]|uniref:Lipoprotein n=1 Tax=Streptomyces cellulosae TaxID=1968 RepID=A0ABW7Y5L6_STRCE